MLPTLQAIPPALCFLVPLFALVLLLIFHCSSPLSLSVIVSLAALASAAGAIGLNAATGLFSLSKAELVVQICLYAELGASVLYLTYKYSSPVPWLAPSRRIKIYTAVLSFFLFCATALGLTSPFVPLIPPVIPPLVFLIFTLSTIPLLAHLMHSHLFPTGPSTPPRSTLAKPFKLSTIQTSTTAAYASVSISPKSNSKPRDPASSSTKLPKLNTAITVLIPPPLPSPASSSASFPSSSDQTHKPGTDHKDPEADLLTPRGSSYSAVALASPKLAAVRDSRCATAIEPDIEAGTHLSTNVAPSSLQLAPLAIREKTILLRSRAKNILIILLMAQLCALLSGALLLVLGVSDTAPGSISKGTSLLRVVETAFMVLCVCGFILAFYLHGVRLEQGGAPLVNGSATAVTQRQDEEARADRVPQGDGGDYPEKVNKKEIRGFGIEKMSGAKLGGAKKSMGFGTGGVSARKKHQRFASVSSSFSSPRPKRTPIITFDHFDLVAEEKKARFGRKTEDEGIELPVLTRGRYDAQLPSPPDTPRVKETQSQWRGEREPREEEVRVGVMRPELKVNVVRDIEPEKYREIVPDIVDTPVSEPGCSNGLSRYASQRAEGSDPRSPRILFSCPASPLAPFIDPKSPVLSFASPKSPALSLESPASPTAYLFGSPTSRSAWKKAERIRARLRRPLTIHTYSARAPSTDLVEGPASKGHHKRGGSRIQEWYPLMSKAKVTRKDGGAKGRDKTREASAESAGACSETADFVDLTDPFASPTPGFVLPKWVNSANSDGGHSSTGCEEGNGKIAQERGSGKAHAQEGATGGHDEEEDTVWSDAQLFPSSENQGPIIKSKATAWGKVPVIVSRRDEQVEVTVADFPALLRKTASTSGGQRGQEGAKLSPKSKGETKERGSRPDSPIPMPAGGLTRTTRNTGQRTPRGLRRTDSPMPMLESCKHSLSSYRSNSSLKASIRSKESPSSFKPPPFSVDAEVLSGLGSMSKRQLTSRSSMGAVDGSGSDARLHESSETPGITRRDSGIRPTARGRAGSPIPFKCSPVRRKGSPVPIPFRSSPKSSREKRGSEGLNGSPSSVVHETHRTWKKPFESERRKNDSRKQIEKDESELNLEEVLLAQKLLSRLDSVYDGHA